MNELIGYTLWARKTIESDIFYKKPDKWFKIFFFLVLKARYKDADNLKRGEYFTTYQTISEYTGATKNQIDRFMRWARDESILTTEKTTRGMVVFILKYDHYQKKENYKDDSPDDTQTIRGRNKDDTIYKTRKQESNNISSKEDTKEFGNPEINFLIDFLKEQKQIQSLDGSIQDNRNYCHNLIRRMNKDYPGHSAKDLIVQIIIYGLQSQFHAKNMTSFRYIFYNYQKIISDAKTNQPKTMINSVG